MAHGYLSNGEEPTFLDLGFAMENAPDPFAGPSAPVGRETFSGIQGCLEEEALDHVLGEVVADMKRSSPPKAAIDSIVGDIQKE
ncbi:UNVERIFIED_CONTAM: hypothetical protein Slati_2821200 [Sesamum latifolium]|uniref:Uncharacterized protein n=1 Tax=Sesamum latifolium TaxID=2727402 RepID=A0AAW2VBZ0_9LAMI